MTDADDAFESIKVEIGQGVGIWDFRLGRWSARRAGS
jgi:hypothetical protein